MKIISLCFLMLSNWNAVILSSKNNVYNFYVIVFFKKPFFVTFLYIKLEAYNTYSNGFIIHKSYFMLVLIQIHVYCKQNKCFYLFLV